MLKTQKGITLIALVITIIVLLILAGVSISAITGENGIVSKAKEARDKTSQAQQEETTALNGYEQTINDSLNNADTVKERVLEISYGCGRKDVIITPIGGYCGPFDYWLRETLDDEQRKRVFYIMTFTNSEIYGESSGLETIMGTLEELKANNVTLLEFAENYLQLDLAGLIYMINSKVPSKNFGYISYLYSLSTIHQDTTEKITEIFEFYTDITNNSTTELDEVLSYVLDMPVTISDLTENYDISEDAIIDILFLHLLFESNETINDRLEQASNPFWEIMYNEDLRIYFR